MVGGELCLELCLIPSNCSINIRCYDFLVPKGTCIWSFCPRISTLWHDVLKCVMIKKKMAYGKSYSNTAWELLDPLDTKDKYYRFHLREVPRRGKVIETGLRTEVKRAGEEGEGSQCLRYRVSLGDDEEGVQTDGWWWWLCNNLNVLNAIELVT